MYGRSAHHDAAKKTTTDSLAEQLQFLDRLLRNGQIDLAVTVELKLHDSHT